MSELVVIKKNEAEPNLALAAFGAHELPPIVQAAGAGAAFAYSEFFANISNKNTKEAYERALKRFFGWLEEKAPGLRLHQIMPVAIRTYLTELTDRRVEKKSGQQIVVSSATRKQHHSALNHFFDKCVERQAIALNPAASLRGERVSQAEGKTPEIGVIKARSLLDSIDTSTLIGKRDKAIIAVMIYTAARVGAVAALRLTDFAVDGYTAMLHFKEKGGKYRQIPCRDDLRLIIEDYIKEAQLDPQTDKTSPLFRTLNNKERKKLSQAGVDRVDIYKMMQRRIKAAELKDPFGKTLSPHSFRVTTITNLLESSVPLEDVQRLAGHADPRTTRLYDRTARKVNKNIVERIGI